MDDVDDVIGNAGDVGSESQCVIHQFLGYTRVEFYNIHSDKSEIIFRTFELGILEGKRIN